MGIKVRVKGDDKSKVVGYYDHQRRRSGEEFEVADEKAIGSWMEKVDEPAGTAKKTDPLHPYKPAVGERKPLDPTAIHVPAGKKSGSDR
jgi:hypothetical protein